MKKPLDDAKIEEITGPTKDDKNMDRNINFPPPPLMCGERRTGDH